jgi:hypothetical protein
MRLGELADKHERGELTGEDVFEQQNLQDEFEVVATSLVQPCDHGRVVERATLVTGDCGTAAA